MSEGRICWRNLKAPGTTFSQTTRLFAPTRAPPPRSCTPRHAAAPFHNRPAKGMPAPTAGWDTVPSSSLHRGRASPCRDSSCSCPPAGGGGGCPGPFPNFYNWEARMRTERGKRVGGSVRRRRRASSPDPSLLPNSARLAPIPPQHLSGSALYLIHTFKVNTTKSYSRRSSRNEDPLSQM